MFASYTTAQLTTFRDAVEAAWLRSLNAVAYGVSTRQLQRAQPDKLFKQLQLIDAELSRRQGGNGISQAAFPDDYGDVTDDGDIPV